MKGIMKKVALLLMVGMVATLAGCSYYEIVDPRTDRTYYTHNWKHRKYRTTGAIEFKDEVTGRTVTLTSHEVRKVKGREYKAGVARAHASH